MESSARPPLARTPHLATIAVAGLMAALAAGAGCVEIGADIGRYVEREEKHFSMSGKPDVVLGTFDGSIEVRPWDKAEVEVIVEKRGRGKDDVAEIDVHSEQSGNHVEVTVRQPRERRFGLHFGGRSAKLIVSLPAASDVSAKSGDGSIDIERIDGRIQLRSGDGSIRARDMGGDLDVNTGDGSIRVGGKLTALRARSGDGRVTVRAAAGSAPAADWDINTGDGSVTLELPEDFAAELDAHTGDGRIHMQDITVSNVTGQIGRNSLRGRLGAGGHTLRVRTGDGSITLRRPPAAEREP